MAIIFLIGRILFGGYFIYSGLNHFRNKDMLSGYARSKHVLAPTTAVLFSGIIIILGGAGVLFVYHIKWALTLIVIFLLTVSFVMHRFWSISDPAMKANEMTNFLKNMALLGAALMIMALSA